MSPLLIIFRVYLSQYSYTLRLPTTEFRIYSCNLLSCPVRALKWYIDRTQNIRGTTEQLFIINVKPFRAASKVTLAGWLVETIKNSKALLGEGKPRAHSVRGFSASWAHANGVSINEILNTVSWRSDSTFTKVYMKDIETRSAPGRYATRILESSATEVNSNK